MASEMKNNTTRLRDLLPGATYLPAGSDPEFAAIQTVATAVRPGDAYLHLDEFDSTGAEVAAARGAVAVIAERLLPDVPTTQVIVEDSYQTQLELAAATQAARSPIPSFIAVGGVSGAASTAALLAAIHAYSGEHVGLLTESCDDDGEHCLPRTRALRGAASQWLRRCGLGGVTTAIAQATPGHATPATPLVACLTTLRCDGLDVSGMPRWASITSHRTAVVEALGNLDGAVLLVFNADEPDSVRFASQHTGRTFSFGESDAADLRIVPVEADSGGQTFIATRGAESACVAIPTPGRAARRDTVAAIATALAIGYDLPTAIRGVDLAPIPKHRLEPVCCGQSFAVRLDAAVRPLDLADALEGVHTEIGRVYATVRLSGDAATARKQLSTAAQLADRVFAYGEIDQVGEPSANVTLVEDRLAAMAVALGLAESGDAVLLAGCRDASDREWTDKLLRRRLECEDRRAAA